MPSVGPFYFGTSQDLGTKDVNSFWIDAQNAEFAPNGNYAECTLQQVGTSGNYESNILGFWDWRGSSIPAGTIITDILISVYGHSGSINATINIAPYNNGIVNSFVDYGEVLTRSDSWFTDLSIISAFPTAPTYSNINLGDVGFAIYLNSVNGIAAFIDSARMTVVYESQPSNIIVSNKFETFPALPWMREGQVPKVRLRKKSRQYFPTGKPLYLQSKAISSNFNQPAISLKLNKNSQITSQTNNSVNESIQRKLSSSVVVQTESVRGSYYFATIIPLHSTAISQSFAYSNSAPILSVVQLKSSALSVSQGYSNGFIEYLNLKGAGLVQSFVFESAKDRTINLESKSRSVSYDSVNLTGPYNYLVELTSEVISVSSGIAVITRSGIGLFSKIIAASYNSGNEIITRPISSKMINSTINTAQESITRKFFSEEISSFHITVTESIKLGLSSKIYTQTDAHAQEIVARPIASRLESFAITNINYSVKQNKSSKVIGISNSKSGETVTRKLSGVAESITIAQKTNGTVNRLFVGSSLAWSNSRAIGGFINKAIHSAMYMQTYVYNNGGVGIRNLSSKSISSNPFHTASSLLQKKNSQIISCSESNSNEKINRPLNSKVLSQSELISSVSIKKLFVGAGISSSLSSTHEHINLNLSSKVYTQVTSHAQEIVTRKLNGQASSIEYVLSQPKVLQNKTSKVVSLTESSSNELVNRILNSQVIAETRLFAETSVKKLITSEVISNSYDSVNEDIRKNLSSKSILATENNSNIKVNRKIHSEIVSASRSNSEPYHSLINLYSAGIISSEAYSELFDKMINAMSTSILSTDASGTSNYLGSKFEVLSRGDMVISQDAINLAPFNYPDDATPYTQ